MIDFQSKAHYGLFWDKNYLDTVLVLNLQDKKVTVQYSDGRKEELLLSDRLQLKILSSTTKRHKT